MLTKVKALIDNQHMLIKGDKVLAACSGGPDSLALVHILDELRLEYNIQLFVAHVDHMFRGEESAADAKFVADFCRERGLVCYQTAINVPRFIEESGASSEEAVARMLRYRYLHQVAEGLGGAKIATGHHQDDQAETVLIHLLRGAGSAGIRAIQAVNGSIIRPLLGVSRQEITRYCELNHLMPRFDSSNANTHYVRNRIRLELLPLLEKQYNPAVKESLCRTACLIGDEHDFVRYEAEKLWNEVVIQENNKTWIPSVSIERRHVAVQREFFRLVIEKKQGHLTGISFSHVETLIQMLINGRVGTFLQLPGGLTVQKEYTGLYMESGKKMPVRIAGGIKPPGYQLKVPGTTHIPELGIEITAEFKNCPDFNRDPYTAVLDWDQVQRPLFVRTRQEGDRFWPSGLSGSKKLKDFFIDKKVPQSVRNVVPLICDEAGILWVGGYRRSHRARITQDTKKFLKLHIINRRSYCD